MQALVRVARLTPGARTAPSGPTSGMSPDPVAILVVEDDAATRTFLADNLTADGYALLTAGCVREAVRALEYHRVDIAIVDVGLPDDSGLELVRRRAGGERCGPTGGCR